MAFTEYSEAYLHASRAWIIVLVNAILLVLALIFMGLRLYTRIRLLPGRQGLEDWLLTSACVGLIILVATSLLEIRYGAGRHFVTVSQEEFILYFKDFYFSTLCYQLTLYLIKCTLIVQYLRIFGMSRGTRIACWVALVFLTLFSGALLMAGIFACWPIYAFWDVTYPGRVGACVALNPMWYAHSGLSIFTDVVIFVIPLPLVRSLRLSMAEKTATLVLFGFGSFGVLASIIRLHELYELSSAADVTWEAVRSVWSVVEVSVFIICACVTGLKPFFDQKVLPLVMRVMPASTTAGSLAVKSTGSPRTTPPWMRSMTRRLGRRRPGTGTPRLSTLRLGTMRFFATTTRADDGESAIGIAPPAAPTFEMRAYAKEANDTCADDNQGNGSIARCSFHSVYKPETSDDHDNTSLTPCTTQKSGRST